MSQPSISWWQKYGTLAQPAYLGTYSTDTQAWLKASMKSAGVTPLDCKLGKT